MIDLSTLCPLNPRVSVHTVSFNPLKLINIPEMSRFDVFRGLYMYFIFDKFVDIDFIVAYRMFYFLQICCNLKFK